MFSTISQRGITSMIALLNDVALSKRGVYFFFFGGGGAVSGEGRQFFSLKIWSLLETGAFLKMAELLPFNVYPWGLNVNREASDQTVTMYTFALSEHNHLAHLDKFKMQSFFKVEVHLRLLISQNKRSNCWCESQKIYFEIPVVWDNISWNVNKN